MTSSVVYSLDFFIPSQEKFQAPTKAIFSPSSLPFKVLFTFTDSGMKLEVAVFLHAGNYAVRQRITINYTTAFLFQGVI